MQEFKPVNSQPRGKVSDIYSKFKVATEEIIESSSKYIANNPRKVLVRGSAAIAFAFTFGYIAGVYSHISSKINYLNSSFSSLDRQNLQIIKKLEDLSAMQASLNERIGNLERHSKARLDTIQNKIEFQEARSEGEKHEKKIENKSKWKKLLPWNWF
ncbi:MAG: hypothetical protein N3G74_01690 [Candidatus Micrarchaeota archaeon]|nr:hypothetical protein [Candidatus Micrarchaeota archaeon]